jgi:nucleotide-binding universal stress UspA family protein
LVHYDGRGASLAALNSALDLMDSDTEVIAVAIVASPRTLPLGVSSLQLATQAESALAAAMRSAALRGVAISTEIVESQEPGPALVEVARARGATIIFWGVQRSEVELGLNPAIEYVLKYAPSKVVLVGP